MRDKTTPTAAVGQQPVNELAELRQRMAELETSETERQRAEEALREAELRYRTVADFTYDWEYWDEPDGTLHYVSPACERITGYTAAQFIANPLLLQEIILPEDREIWERHRHYATEAPRPQEVRFRIQRRDGGIVWIEHACQPVTDERGVLLGIRSSNRDITERKRAQEALRRERDFAKGLIETAQAIVLVLDTEGRIVRFNPYMEEISGYRPEEVQGKDWFTTFLPERDQDWVRELFLEAVGDTQTRGNVNLIVTKDGREREIEWYDKTLKDTDGNIIGLLAIGQDITERKRAEEETRRLNAELEQRVVERTAELEAANEELGAFVSSVSHDLRAPLRAIRGFADIIARRHRVSLNEEGQHYFDNIVQAGGQMSDLIDDLLAYSRLGRRAVRHRPVDLGDLLAQVSGNMANRVAETGAHLSIPDDLPVIRGDWTLLSGIFTNLLDNGLAYHRPGVVPRVEVACQAEADHVVVRVADNGIGIPAEFHEKIFAIFQRLHSQDEYPGTGIGLAIVKRSVGLLGGRVWVESVVGEGSTFCVELPRT